MWLLRGPGAGSAGAASACARAAEAHFASGAVEKTDHDEQEPATQRAPSAEPGSARGRLVCGRKPRRVGARKVSSLDGGTSGAFYLDSFTSNTQAAVDHDFLYDGDGKRILGTDGEKETIYLGGYYEYETVDHTGEEITVLEAGTVTGVTDVPTTVTLSHSFANPVVIAQPLSQVGTEASVVRLSGVRSTQFTVEIEEPGGGTHPNGETLSYMVFEAGSWEVDLGKAGTLRIEASLVDTGATVGKNVANVWESVTFGTAFSAAPAVFTQVQTEYDAGWLTTRQRNVATTGVDMAMEVHDAQTTVHAHEVLGWVAVEVKAGTVASHVFEVGKSGNNVTHNWYTLPFNETHGTTQWFVASLATYNGADGSHLRYKNLSASSVQVEVEEEDETGSHTSEDVHYFMLSTTSGGGTLVGTGTRTRVRKYYNGVAMREGEKMYFMLTDHLGSTSEVVQPEFDTAAISNTLVSRVRYAPFGAQRYASADLPTEKTYTGQYGEPGLGLMFYNARWYDAALGRFVQADTIVPGEYNPAAWDRFAYVNNNPVNFNDPDGHCPRPPDGWGPAICVALFIKPSEISASPFTLHGDGREFGSATDPGASRGYIWVRPDGNKVESHMNPSGYITGPALGDLVSDGYIFWYEPSDTNTWTITATDSGFLTIEFDLVISGPLGIGGAAPHINGTFTFRINPDGSIDYNFERDGFPWAEAYYYDEYGNVITIFLDPANRANPYDLFANEPDQGIISQGPELIQGSGLGDPQSSSGDSFCTPGEPC